MPSWSVPIIALCSPLLFITLYSRIWRASRLEVHNAILGGLSCVIFTALVTNLVKLAVRPLSWQLLAETIIMTVGRPEHYIYGTSREPCIIGGSFHKSSTWMGLRSDAGVLQVGRPRPNFVALCWPEGDVTWDANSGMAVCSKGAKNAAEGRKSFPSGGSLSLCISTPVATSMQGLDRACGLSIAQCGSV